MGEMAIPEQVVTRDVLDYDFSFSNGMRLPITVDLELGDTVEDKDGKLVICLTSKPSSVNPDVMMPAETITIFLDKVSAIVFRQRKQLVTSPDEALGMKRLIHEMAKGIQ